MILSMNKKVPNAYHQDGRQATVKTIIQDVLGARLVGDPCKPALSMRLYNLYSKIGDSIAEIDLDFDDIGLIRERVGKAQNHSHFVIGFLLDHLPQAIMGVNDIALLNRDD